MHFPSLATERNFVLTRCDRGKATYSTNVTVPSRKDIKYSAKFCPENANCFKMARRRIFARQNVRYFVPNTFVGALFECSSESQCWPYAPLIADDFSKHWLSVSPSKLTVLQSIPYMSTPLRWDPRFAKHFGRISNLTGPWWEGIDVDERYTGSTLHLASLWFVPDFVRKPLRKLLSPHYSVS